MKSLRQQALGDVQQLVTSQFAKKIITAPKISPITTAGISGSIISSFKKPSIKTIPKIDTSLSLTTGTKTKTDVASGLGLASIEEQMQRLGLGLRGRTKQGQKQMNRELEILGQPTRQKSIPKTALRLRQVFQEPRARGGFFSFSLKAPKFVAFPPVIPFPLLGQEGKKKKRRGKRDFFRVPSFASLELGLTAPKPLKFEITGLVERPVIKKRKKRK